MPAVVPPGGSRPCRDAFPCRGGRGLALACVAFLQCFLSCSLQPTGAGGKINSSFPGRAAELFRLQCLLLLSVLGPGTKRDLVTDA